MATIKNPLVVISGGTSQISIDPVTNLTYSKPNLSWTAPDITNYSSFNPILSYLVTINQTETETSSTTLNITNYLSTGSNTISVVAKLVLTTNSSSNDITVIYTEPVYKCVLVDATLPSNGTGFRAASVGNYIYIFGNNKTYKFNSTTKTIATLNPQFISDLSSISVGNDIYIFGGNNIANTINKLDTTTDTVTTLSITLSYALVRLGAALAGTNIYIFGGVASGTKYNTIYKFDTTTDTIATLNTTLPVATMSMATTFVNNNIYLFGGTQSANVSTIYKFDTTTETITTLNTTLPQITSMMASSNIGGNIYLFGGFNNTLGQLNTIYKFDTTTETLTLMNITMPGERYDIGIANIVNDIYLFGGSGLNNTATNTIFKFYEE